MLGHFFCKWMARHLALWILRVRRSDPTDAAWRRDLFTCGRFAISLIVIAETAKWRFFPRRVGVVRHPLVNAIRCEAIGRSGIL